MRLRRLISNGESRQEARLARLQASPHPIHLYGAGVYAYVLYKFLTARGIRVEGAVVDRNFRTADRFLDLPLGALEDVAGQNLRHEFVIATADYPRAWERLRQVGVSEPWLIDVPDFLNIPAPFMDYRFFEDHLEQFELALSAFDDDLSRKTFVTSINAKILEDVELLREVTCLDHLYFPSTEFAPRLDERLLDVGGYNGDSVRDFHRITGGRYQRIVSLEPFESSFRALERTAEALDRDRIRPLKIGAWDDRTTLSFHTQVMDIDNRCAENGDLRIEVDRIDAILKAAGETASFVKLDINGAEARALAGAQELIAGRRPCIATKLHVKEDYYRIPLLLKSIAPDIRLFLRQRNYMSMMLVLYGRFDD